MLRRIVCLLLLLCLLPALVELASAFPLLPPAEECAAFVPPASSRERFGNHSCFPVTERSFCFWQGTGSQDTIYSAIPKTFSEEDRLNIDCLLASYPSLAGVEEDSQGLWLKTHSGERIFYGGHLQDQSCANSLAVNVRESMRTPYTLEPERPETPKGYAPGRKRPYELFYALYGKTPSAVREKLVTVRALRQSWRFTPEAANSFLRAAAVLEGKLVSSPQLRPWLRSAGTFLWRPIAGETVLSAHSFGIAFDIGVATGATYWRWCPLSPHPMQKTFSPDIVAAFEREGFIWGGKWHEYDLMHFEYRPELICKAQALRKKNGGGLP